jgi:hypothetical protein
MSKVFYCSDQVARWGLEAFLTQGEVYRVYLEANMLPPATSRFEVQTRVERVFHFLWVMEECPPLTYLDRVVQGRVCTLVAITRNSIQDGVLELTSPKMFLNGYYPNLIASHDCQLSQVIMTDDLQRLIQEMSQLISRTQTMVYL